MPPQAGNKRWVFPLKSVGLASDHQNISSLDKEMKYLLTMDLLVAWNTGTATDSMLLLTEDTAMV